MIYAVVPAAGRSRRMGQPKLLLRVNGQAVIEHVVSALREGGVDRVLVVVGPHVPAEVDSIAVAAGAGVLRLPRETAAMRETVEHGLGWIESRWHPDGGDGWLLAPADYPLMRADVVRRLIDCQQNRARIGANLPSFPRRRESRSASHGPSLDSRLRGNDGTTGGMPTALRGHAIGHMPTQSRGHATRGTVAQSIFVPMCDGRRGHPTLFSWQHVTGIGELPGEFGIDEYLRRNPDITVEISVQDASVLNDLDTPDDCERLRAIGGY